MGQEYNIRESSQNCQQATRSLSKGFLMHDKTDYKAAVGRKFVEVARMHGNSLRRQELDRQILVWTRYGNF